jgi:hypothetical protein
METVLAGRPVRRRLQFLMERKGINCICRDENEANGNCRAAPYYFGLPGILLIFGKRFADE